MRRVIGILLLVLSAVVFAAATVLVLTNVGDKWSLHLYYKDVSLSRALLMILAGAGGIVIWLVARHVLPAGLRSLRAASRAKRQRQTEQRLKKLETQDKQPPA